MRDLFAADPARGERLTLEAAGIYLDYSKNRITDETMRAAASSCAEQSGLRERIDAMFAGEKINITEDRAVLHVALRAPSGERIEVDGVDVVPAVHEVLDRMAEFADAVRGGRWTGHTGKPIRNIVNIGIGGSDLGPVMAYEALRHYSDRDLTFRFVSNVDGTDFAEATHDLDPAETLFIVSSKTFTTLETMTNAATARDWRWRAGDDVGGREALRRGVDQRRRGRRSSASTSMNMFGFWDWVGGRYSMDSAIGLSTMIAIGPDAVPRDAGRLSRDGRALPHRAVRREPAGAAGPADRLVHRLLRRADPGGAAVRPVPEAVPGLPAAADDGVQRQARHAGRARGRLRDRRRSTGASRAPTASTASTS